MWRLGGDNIFHILYFFFLYISNYIKSIKSLYRHYTNKVHHILLWNDFFGDDSYKLREALVLFYTFGLLHKISNKKGFKYGWTEPVMKVKTRNLFTLETNVCPIILVFYKNWQGTKVPIFHAPAWS
jgi:hypothetical protein